VPNIRSTRFIRAIGVVAGVFLALVAGVASSSADSNLEVSLSGSPVAGNGHATLTVDITNHDTNDATPTTTLTLPGGVAFVSASGGAVCTGSGIVSCTHGTVTGNDGTDTFDVTVNPDHTATGSITASAADGSLTSNTASVDIATEADLVPTISAAAGSHIAGDPDGFDYTVTVHNDGPSDNVGGYTLTGTLPSGVEFDPSGDCSGSGTSFTCSNPSGLVATQSNNFTVQVKALSSAAAGTPNAHVSVVSGGTTDPTSANNAADTDPDVSIITRADLEPSITAPTGAHVAGDPAGFVYSVSVTNHGLSDNTGGYTVTGTLPVGVEFDPSGDCSGSGTSFTCSNPTGLVATQSNNFTVQVKALSSAAAGTPNAHVSVVSGGTTDPTSANNAADTDPDVSIITRANLTVSLTSSPPSNVLANGSTLTYGLTVTNNGFSYARNVVVGALPSQIVNSRACRIVAAGDCSSNGDFTAGAFSIGVLTDGETATMRLRGEVSSNLRALTPPSSQTFTYTARATSDTPAATMAGVPTDNRSNGGLATSTYDTVPDPPRSVQAVPGNGNVIVTFQPPTLDGSHVAGSAPIDQYVITVTAPPGGAPASPPPVPANAPRVVCPNGTSTDCYRLNITGLTNDRPAAYRFDVQAHNAVGTSDIGTATTTATPSSNATAQIVPNATAQTLTTCTTATSTQPTCVKYLIPSGNGGVFGAQGNVSLANFVCGTFGSCFSTTGAQNLGALAGYNDRTKPLVEIINWDSTTLPSTLPLRPVCSTNSTATNCFPNNLPIFYEASAFLLANDPRGATYLNAPGGPHFCSLATNKGGAGNVNYARPKPASGYTDTAGSACIQKISVLNGLPGRPNDKGDVQVVINLTSDSDALAGHH
jgi:hypothetical protein